MTPTIPIAKQPDLAQIEHLRPLVADRRCVVIGSAPLATRYAQIEAYERTIPVNGGISSVGGAVDLWVVNSKAQDECLVSGKARGAEGSQLREKHRQMMEQCKGRTVGHVFMLRGPKVASEQLTLAALAAMKFRHQSWSICDKATKRFIEGELCGRTDDKKPCSSGILTVAMALYAGAASVRLVGFSFSPGYNYLPKEKPQSWWRDHIAADKRALAALRATYGTRLSGDLVREAVAA